MRRFNTILPAIAAWMLLAPAPAAVAAAPDLPCSTARLIVPWNAGGGTDVIFRIVADAANKAGAKPELQVVNIGGQGGNKGAKEAQAAAPDGCTLFAIHQSAITSYFTGRVDFTWDAFEPVSLLTRTPPIYGAHPEAPFDNVSELVQYAKANPGTVLAGATLGSTSHFWYLLLADAAGIDLKYIPYDGTRERMTALLASNIHTGEINLAAAKKYIQTGELKALGILTPERHRDIPDVPTLREQGIELVGGTDRGIVAPKGTPKEIVDHYAAILKSAMESSEVTQAMASKGTAVIYKDPAAYTAYFQDTQSKWEAVARKVGIYKRGD